MEVQDRKWRIGRNVGRTIYAQVAGGPSDEDIMIGVMDTAQLAKSVTEGHNLLQNTDLGAAASSLEEANLEITRLNKRLETADKFVDWLLAMNDPLDAEGRSRRQRVTLDWIFQEAQTVRDTRIEELRLG